jgi:hypothetical protein
MPNYKHSLFQVSQQLRDQLISDKRKLGFLFGAGTSMSVGIPGVIELTKIVSENINEDVKKDFLEIKKLTGSENIEHVLNKVRTVRELLDDSEDAEVFGIKGKAQAKVLDVEICKAISSAVNKVGINIDPHKIFANWLFQNQATRYSPIELFTTNYDLLFETALEYKKIPYFDGFVGAIQPFLIPECVEAENIKKDQSLYIPSSWIRLWKLHGSINWFLTTFADKTKRIIRTSLKDKTDAESELMIYPSKQKYDESRRLPFLTFQDRLRRFLGNGEVLLVIAGYNFGDDHINEIIFQTLRANKRLAITALVYGENTGGSDKRITNEVILNYGTDNPNLTIIGPDKGCIGGVIAEWDQDDPKNEMINFWNKETGNSTLGDFRQLSDYLQMNFGLIKEIQETADQDAK